ncbi:hypothetical protein [Archaeoglobus profundus]|uniref:Uncharacterized protein n=1 Tax=Archaeoglobus profundus (strain DSM 5631 / JCM 9629 / NBRC 100127 / Av18) TaxID=572546 RepID=D2REL2_ARCPA|nr:hypothetical protein [Archaeoglobus profundus]ADB58556.1 hypothetical protein Arcpr_1510 [Archaeoglobus profundus DSM 5631]
MKRVRYADIGHKSMLQCPVCGHLIKYSSEKQPFRKPRAADLAKHISFKSPHDEKHKKWIIEKFGEFPIDYEIIRKYLEETEYEVTGELLGVKIYRPI